MGIYSGTLSEQITISPSSQQIGFESPPLADRVLMTLHRGEETDPFGHKVQLALAWLWAFFLPFEMIPWAKDGALALLVTWSVIRFLFGGIMGTWRPLLTTPLAWTMIGLLAWVALSVTWSSHPAWGLEELKGMRMLALPLIIFPVIRRLRVLINGFLLGVAIINLLQIGQLIELPGFWTKMTGRQAAWCSPMPLGFVCAAAIIGHIAILTARWKHRHAFLHIIGIPLAAVGLILCQNRGGLVAVVITVPIMLLVAAAVRPHARQVCLFIMAAMTFGIATAWTIDDALLDNAITNAAQNRWNQAKQELTGEGTYSTHNPVRGRSIGTRLVSWRAMQDIITEHPWRGVGAGGIASQLGNYPGLLIPPGETRPPKNWPIEPFQPHSSWLWTMAATGLTGFTLLMSTVLLGLIGQVRRVAEDPAFLATFGILFAWCIASVFDTLLISGVTEAALALALCGGLIRQVGGSTR
ncbi:MAG: O-antigen ligase family protein [Phycisphaerales bacterium]|nr:O-antigen ligase family protein [Phycisphaerales bacterium]